MGGVSEIGNGLLQWDTSRREGKRMQQAANDANTMQLNMFNQLRDDQAPWREAGKSALPNLQDQSQYKDFSMEDFKKDPGYQFRMDEGQKAIERSAAARGGLNSGGTMKALANYGQGLASEEYNNAYNRYTADRDSRFNRLASLAGIGQVANTQIGNAGQNFANAFGQNIMSGANARAAANIGGVQAFSQGVTNHNKQTSQMAGSMMAMFCDKRVKKNLSPITKADIAEFKDNIQPLFFEYISSEYGDGDFAGPIAQDLEKSKLGRTLVKTNSQGIKIIDPTRALMLLLALHGKAA